MTAKLFAAQQGPADKRRWPDRVPISSPEYPNGKYILDTRNGNIEEKNDPHSGRMFHTRKEKALGVKLKNRGDQKGKDNG